MITEIPSCNIFDQGITNIVIPTNMALNADGMLVMGAGLALQAKQRVGIGIAINWGDHYSMFNLLRPEEKFLFDYIAEYEDSAHGQTLISFPTKFHWKDNSDLTLIRRSAEHLAYLYKDREEKVLMPQVGTGLGRLKWERVKPILDSYLDERFFVINHNMKE